MDYYLPICYTKLRSNSQVMQKEKKRFKSISVFSRKKNRPARIGGYTTRNSVELVQAGEQFFNKLISLIDSATHSIHFQTYIFDKDHTGAMVAEALIRAAERKVRINLLVDGFASQNISGAFRHKFESAGIHFRFFEPLFRSQRFYVGRRLHHKVIVVDGVKAMVGSMNIADRYNDIPPVKAWYDVAVYVEGETATELYQVCNRVWSKQSIYFQLPAISEEILLRLPEDAICPVRVRRNDWLKGENGATRTYFELVKTAKESVTIVCSYFLPTKRLMNQLSAARKRGVKINIILAGTTDVITAKYAERYLYRWMLRNKFDVYEYQPTVLHAKLAVADESWLTLGSYNVNGLSDYASIELNLDIRKKEFAKEVQQTIAALIEKDCIRIDPGAYSSIFSFRQLLHWSAFQFYRLMVRIFTFRSRVKD